MGQVIKNRCGMYTIVKENGDVVEGKVLGVHENGEFKHFEVKVENKTYIYCTQAYMDRWIGEDVEY